MVQILPIIHSIWWYKLADWCSPCFWHNIHHFTDARWICWFPLISLHFYIVSICDVYLSISKMRNALANGNRSNTQTRCLYIPNEEQKLWKYIRIAIYKYACLYILFWFDAVHRFSRQNETNKFKFMQNVAKKGNKSHWHGAMATKNRTSSNDMWISWLLFLKVWFK